MEMCARVLLKKYGRIVVVNKVDVWHTDRQNNFWMEKKVDFIGIRKSCIIDAQTLT